MLDEPTELEKKFAIAWFDHPDIPLVYDPNSSHYRQTIREIMQETAYHEAGHYVARCFTGFDISHVVRVSIIPDRENAGRVICERSITEHSLESYPQSLQRCNGRMLLLVILAGAGAVLRWAADEEGLESIFDYWGDEYFEYCEQEGTDQFRAVRIATIMKKPHVSVSRILNLADKWTMEMLSIPGVWNAVEIIANRLLESGEIEGEELVDIVTAMEGGGFKIPYYLTLPKWRRRLAFR